MSTCLPSLDHMMMSNGPLNCEMDLPKYLTAIQIYKLLNVIAYLCEESYRLGIKDGHLLFEKNIDTIKQLIYNKEPQEILEECEKFRNIETNITTYYFADRKRSMHYSLNPEIEDVTSLDHLIAEHENLFKEILHIEFMKDTISTEPKENSEEEDY